MTDSKPPTIIDLSFPIRNSPEGTPAFQQVSLTYADHAAGAA